MPQLSTLMVPWPQKGINRSTSLQGQPAGTTPDAINVRNFDAATGRARGSQRPGLSRYLDAQLSAGNAIQCLNQVTTSTVFSGATSMTTRSIRRVAVSAGNVSMFDRTSFTAATSGASALSAAAPVIHSAELFGRVYFADGASQKYWNAASNTVSTWTISAGSFPVSGGNKPRLIEMWNSRLVMSGLVGDEHNYFMTKAGDPTDLDYSPAAVNATQAVAGNLSDAGRIGDVINAIAPWSNEICVFGCDHSIWLMLGDPAAGGRASRISDVVGMAWGRPYCTDAYGNLWFFGSRGGVYMLSPGGGAPPERVTSGSIDEELAQIDLSTTVIRMAWNDREQGVHLFATALDGSESRHYFFDARMKAWWVDLFASVGMNPVSVHVFDGDQATDRAILLGARDSRVYQMDIDARDDDGQGIDSYVYLGPIRTGKPMERLILRETQTVLASSSGAVDYEIFAGNCPEEAFESERPVRAGKWRAGRNPSSRAGASGDAIFYKLRGCHGHWSIESLAATVERSGPEAQRRL